MAGKFLAKKKRNPRNRVLLAVLFAFFLAVAAFSGWKLLQAGREYAVGEDTYAALAQAAVVWQTPSETAQDSVIFLPAQTETEGAPQEQPTEQPVQEAVPKVDFAMLANINSEVVGWISSPDGISYPVVQGTDNEYYLDHLFDGTYNSNGSIFVDYRNAKDFSDRNTFIYGHNMRNGTMFAGLVNYGSQSYYEKYPKLLLTTTEQTYLLEVFAGYVTPGNSDSYQISFADDAVFEAYLQKVRALSDFTADVEVTAQDRIVTLSTCTYDYEEARYVLHCRLTPIG